MSIDTSLNPYTKKPYDPRTQPGVIHLWLSGSTEPGSCRPKQHLPWYGVMQDPDVKSIECRDDRLFGYGHFIARRGEGDTIEVSLCVPDGAVSSVARRVVRCALRRGFEVVSIGPNGTPRQAAEMVLHAIEKMLRRSRPMSQWQGPWRLTQAAQEVARLAKAGTIPPERVDKVIVALRAKVSLGRLQGWSENACTGLMTEIGHAEKAIRRYAEAA